MGALSVKIRQEVYIYMNGALTMKLWLKPFGSVTFDVRTYGQNTLKSIKNGTNNNMDYISDRGFCPLLHSGM
jgi:hypothetical protein